MTDRIKLLPDAVANQIAAGEVVSRPASAVKELMENAVDAGSTSVTVNFRDGGKALIQVVDNGCGMSPVDARLAFDRHATSKISSVEDIYRLHSFGFRGEALASIASVAEVELRTRQADSELGTSVRISGSRFEGQEHVSAPAGTQFIVKNLFFNVPARRRFLKEAPVEARHITTEFQRVALCHPQIAFTLCNNDTPVYNLPPATLRQRIVQVIGKGIASNLLDLGVETSLVGIEGFVGRPAMAKKNNKEQYLFVNGRYFRSPYFHKAVLSAYEKLIPPDTQPSYFLYFTIDPQLIDVNVHPTKTEIKFDNEQAIWQIIAAAVRESLGKLGVVPMMDFDKDTSVDIPVFKKGVPYTIPQAASNPRFNPFREESAMEGSADGRTGAARAHSPIGPDGCFSIESSLSSGSDLAAERGFPSVAGFGLPSGDESILAGEEPDEAVIEFISGGDATQGEFEIESGTLFEGIFRISNRYFASSYGAGNLAVIDAVRAHECVLYEQYLLMLGNNSSVCQQLLFPEPLSLPTPDVALLREYEADFTALGFDFSFGDDHGVELRGVPVEFGSAAPTDILHELLVTLSEKLDTARDVRRRLLAAVMARRCAIGTARAMSDTELEALLAALMNCENYSYTPSGKPVILVITGEEIGKRLK
ncbi:MAG: DNA mismatch repair endonuclease MutL [Rikenellaceae bacterium]|nr:DNA mismatch repair endonuclease MutL [Rikenellaceae bacterium]